MKSLFVFVTVCFFSFCLMGQNVGIGTTTPKARLHVSDSAVLFTGPAELPGVFGLPPATGAGTRWMWYPNKAAFRSGQVTGSQWNEANVGLHSASLGYNTRAAGQYSFSTGFSASASGIASFAAGDESLASGVNAAVFGTNTTAKSYGSFVVGRYNVVEGNNTEWISTDPLFVVGNGLLQNVGGVGEVTRRNAFTILKNGNLELGGNSISIDSVGINNGPLTINTLLNVKNRLAFNPAVYTYGEAGLNILNTTGSYFVVKHAGTFGTIPYFLTLSPGIRTGQILLLQCGEGRFGLIDDPTYNTNLSTDNHSGYDGLIFEKGDLIILLWDGTLWNELSYSHVAG
ncbi:MAG: hypothetical protein V4717_09275 [Bacteroidota bacterium]